MLRPLKHLSDLPLNEDGRKKFNEYRLDPIIEILEDVLKEWLDTKQRDGVSPPRIGVYGGYGQGKSTVIKNVSSNLEKPPSRWEKCREFFCGKRIMDFDVSFYKTDNLEWRFFEALLSQRAKPIKFGVIPVFSILLIAAIYWLGKLDVVDCVGNLKNCEERLLSVGGSLGTAIFAVWALLKAHAIKLIPVFAKLKTTNRS